VLPRVERARASLNRPAGLFKRFAALRFCG
jgi:hypothetical protein